MSSSLTLIALCLSDSDSNIFHSHLERVVIFNLK